MTRLGFDLAGPSGAPVVVLSGSLGTTRRMWRPQVEALSARWRVLCVDHRGHGDSAVPPGPYTIAALGRDLLALLDQLKLARVSYCGLSLGGMLGMWLARHAPDRLDRLVLLCTAAHLPPPHGWRQRAAQVRAGGTAAVAEAVVARWFTPAFRAREPGTVATFTAMLTSIAAEGYAGCAEAIAALDLRRDLPRITAPTLVLAGGQDPAIPPETVAAVAAGIPGARFTVVNDAAHLASVEQPAVVNHLLHTHLTGGDR